ncbi:MAG TPA: hypothetical protein VLL96_04565, partial [Candidatus Deferrimicrobiaceae bacterium]|nr:hypothetical protein [Candidatus Deferrimicrobiaceae bacterium]
MLLNKPTLTVAIKFAAITATVIAFYLQDLNLVFRNALSDESTYHILAIPFLFGYLLYRKRKMVSATLNNGTQNVSSVLAKNFTVIV